MDLIIVSCKVLFFFFFFQIKSLVLSAQLSLRRELLKCDKVSAPKSFFKVTYKMEILFQGWIFPLSSHMPLFCNAVCGHVEHLSRSATGTVPSQMNLHQYFTTSQNIDSYRYCTYVCV